MTTEKGFHLTDTGRDCHESTYSVHVSNDGSDSRQPSPSTGNDANVLVRVLTDFSTPVGAIIEVCDGLTKF